MGAPQRGIISSTETLAGPWALGPLVQGLTYGQKRPSPSGRNNFFQDVFHPAASALLSEMLVFFILLPNFSPSARSRFFFLAKTCPSSFPTSEGLCPPLLHLTKPPKGPHLRPFRRPLKARVFRRLPSFSPRNWLLVYARFSPPLLLLFGSLLGPFLLLRLPYSSSEILPFRSNDIGKIPLCFFRHPLRFLRVLGLPRLVWRPAHLSLPLLCFQMETKNSISFPPTSVNATVADSGIPPFLRASRSSIFQGSPQLSLFWPFLRHSRRLFCLSLPSHSVQTPPS